jgi:hypothetical protein
MLASLGAVPLGLAPALRVHRISTNKEGHKMTTTTDRSELLAQLSEGIAKLTTSEEWQRHLDCQSRFYRYRTGSSAISERCEFLWTTVTGALRQC